MKTLFILSILNIGLSCSNKSKEDIKTIKNDKQLIAIVDSISKVEKSTINLDSSIVTKNIKQDTIVQEPEQYEDFIEEAIAKLYKEKDISSIDKKLNELNNDNKISKTYKTYWKTYLYYYKSLYYKNMLKDDYLKISKSIVE